MAGTRSGSPDRKIHDAKRGARPAKVMTGRPKRPPISFAAEAVTVVLNGVSACEGLARGENGPRGPPVRPQLIPESLSQTALGFWERDERVVLAEAAPCLCQRSPEDLAENAGHRLSCECHANSPGLANAVVDQPRHLRGGAGKPRRHLEVDLRRRHRPSPAATPSVTGTPCVERRHRQWGVSRPDLMPPSPTGCCRRAMRSSRDRR